MTPPAPSPVAASGVGEQPPSAVELNLLGSEYGNMLSCVRCGQCLTSCPTYVLSGREAEGPRGRVALARAVHDGVLPLTRRSPPARVELPDLRRLHRRLPGRRPHGPAPGGVPDAPSSRTSSVAGASG